MFSISKGHGLSALSSERPSRQSQHTVCLCNGMEKRLEDSLNHWCLQDLKAVFLAGGKNPIIHGPAG